MVTIAARDWLWTAGWAAEEREFSVREQAPAVSCHACPTHLNELWCRGYKIAAPS
jgi:hypothetical protein